MIKLKFLEKEDFAKILKWNEGKSEDFLLQWAGPHYKYPLTFSQLEEYFIKEAKKENFTTFIYKIMLDNTDEVIGTVELREIDKENRVGRVCRFLIGEESTRGKGIGTEVLKELLSIGFKEIKFHKITLGVFDFNHCAIRCYEKAGFVKENLKENYRETKNGYWNLYDMGITKAEWKAKIY